MGGTYGSGTWGSGTWGDHLAGVDTVTPPPTPPPEPGDMRQGVCTPWATAGDVCGMADDFDADDARLGTWIGVASDILYELTGRAWPGTCTDYVRPCGQHCGPDLGRCRCGGLQEIRLPAGPAVSVTAVKVDGVELDPSLYRLDERRRLVRLPDPDGSRSRWPACQRLDLPDDDAQTFSVEYLFGADPPRGGVEAAASLGYQLALSCDPAQQAKCRLPKRLQTVSRQGVTIAVLDPMKLIEEGRTGLPEVDLWVASVRLGRTRRRGGVYDPTRTRTVRRTGV